MQVQAGWAGAATPLGFLLMEAGRASEAVPFLAGVAEGAPSSCSARLNLAIALKQAGRLQEAVAAFEQVPRAVSVAPGKNTTMHNVDGVAPVASTFPVVFNFGQHM